MAPFGTYLWNDPRIGYVPKITKLGGSRQRSS